MAERYRRGTCRIIGGQWRGRKIRFDDAEGLRPTTDRIRETVFNWLQPYLYQRHCLDCFAGSGILGYEALSRGAADVLFIERNRKTVASLRDNIRLLDTDRAEVLQADTLDWLASVNAGRYFDLVFLDPPFHSGLLAKTCAVLDSSACLADNAVIYIEHADKETVELPDNWICFKQKASGQVSYQLFEKRALGQRG